MLPLAVLLTALLDTSFGVTMEASRRLPPIDLIHSTTLDQRGAYIMLWTPYEDEIVIEIQVRTRGYVGLGFSRTGGMKDADIVIGWVDDGGTVHFSDRHALGNRTPVEDSSQDYKLLGGFANDTHTVLRFSRPWITCDINYDFILTKDTVRVIWAYDALQPDPSTTVLRYHDHRGVKSLYLMEPKMADLPSPARLQSWDVRAPDVEVPGTVNTLYWCRLYKIPSLPWKHQVIGYVPLIEEVSLPHVHHMLLYECSLPNSEDHFEQWIQQKGAQCYSSNMPISWTACGTPIIAWATGSQGEMFPEHVGFPLGEKYGGSTYFLLEIHYDNPEFKKGIVDKSGLRLLLTDEIRPQDAGVLTVGHKVEPSMIIPPSRVWTTTAHCTADCTEKTIPAGGIKVFSAIMHAHLLGEAISLKHIRNGRELEPLVIDKSYDFNYQQARFFSEEKVVKPGDHLTTVCVYNSSNRGVPTFGGFGTKDEMCLLFLSYYPRIDLGECYSRPDLALLFDVFGIQNLYDIDIIMKTFSQDHFDVDSIDRLVEEARLKKMMTEGDSEGKANNFQLVDFFRIINISEPAELRGKSFYQILTADSTWRDPSLIERLEEAVSTLQYEPSCLYSGRGMVHGLPKKAKIPHYTPYEPPRQSCIQSPLEGNDVQSSQSFQDEAARVNKKYASSRNSGGNEERENSISNEKSSLRGDRNISMAQGPTLLPVYYVLLLVLIRVCSCNL